MNQTVRALLKVRELILEGALGPGERLSELALVERLAVSRTPLRTALVKLEQEGFLEALSTGGFKVRSFSRQDVFDSIEVRGALEGVAARYAAQRELKSYDLRRIKDCLQETASFLAEMELPETDFVTYIELNDRFHTLIKQLSGSPTIISAIDKANALPFASHNSFVEAQSNLEDARLILLLAHDHHCSVVDAIENRESGRAEMLMKEHSRLASRNLMNVLNNRKLMSLIPGSSLIAHLS
jgi:GntR family transcriptional regulator of vanillate catabolism